MRLREILTTGVVLLLLVISCKEEIVHNSSAIIATTDKSVYNSGQLITVTVKNFMNKSVYINQCGDNLYPAIVRIDTSSAGGTSFTYVCRQLKNYELKSLESVSDTLSLLTTGRYRLKYLYDFENVMPELCREELYSNEFNIQ